MKSKTGNKRARGDRFEKKIESFLQSLGWITERAHPRLKFIRPGITRSVSHDFWGCFDLISLHRQTAHSLLIQASIAKQLANKKKAAIDEMLGPKDLPQWPHYVQVWLRDDSARNRIIVLQRTNQGAWIETSFRMEEGVWPSHVIGPEPNQPTCPI